jgi:hypothetical protein
MDKIRFESHITFTSLGKLQGPILDAIRSHLTGSTVDFVPLPFGRPGIVVHWDGFYGMSMDERRVLVRRAIEQLGPDIADKVDISLTVTNDESADLERSYSGLLREAALENAPTQQLQLYAIVKPYFDAVYSAWYNIVDEMMFVNGISGSIEKTISFANGFAERFAEYDRMTQKAIAETVLTSAFGLDAPNVTVGIESGADRALVWGDGESVILDIFPVQ